MTFCLNTSYTPKGDQPAAIEKLSKGVDAGEKAQVLLGITGSGKTFTMANIIAKTQRPTLILAHNKTLAAQLYQEFKEFFPENAVEYFVSYYDYYQPEAYIPRTDTYIEKDMSINDQIDKMRLSATFSLLERRDVIIVASVSCIYGLGSPEFFKGMNLPLKVGEDYFRDDLLLRLVHMQYKRNDDEFYRATFRVRGEVIEIFPSYESDKALRLEFFGDELEQITEIDPLTGKIFRKLDSVTLYPGSHHVTPESVRLKAVQTIEEELQERAAYFEAESLLLERERILQRTKYDLEMIREVGFCKGIENFSRHFDQRAPGTPPNCLLDYFPDDYLLFIDESHQTVPQVRAMYNGDRARKQALVEFGFRLPSAYDNRPLKFEEFYALLNQVIYVSATPASWEVEEAAGVVVEQIIRPTGLLDPEIEVRPAKTQVDDSLDEIQNVVKGGGRVLVTTLTKKLAEDLTKYLKDLGVKARYLHSDIDTIERIEIIRDLRKGIFDVLVGVNLLREGLDIPEVKLVAILDGDKEGFLRSKTSLIQTCGRAARNTEGKVILYADKRTEAIEETLKITALRRQIQANYNQKHGITPQNTSRKIEYGLFETPPELQEKGKKKIEVHSIEEVRKQISFYKKKMLESAENLQFEEAAKFRDLMHHFQKMEMELPE